MGGMIVFGFVVFLGYSLYRAGKRTGSIKGYNVGRSRGRRRW
jgi:Na+/proline symporter